MSAELEFLQGETPGRKVALTGAELTIGRDSTANLILSHPNVSRQHAKIIYQGDTWYISDLGSTNGTIVNGRRISASPLQLRHGDLIEIGPYVLRFQDFGVSFWFVDCRLYSAGDFMM
jgi:pSer/pThr/pTyr-binding forkhead associated (FHA) protein